MFGRFAIVGSAALLGACATSVASGPESAALDIAPDQQAFLDACEPWDDWDKPAPPFNVYGDTYYVGTCGIASILITNDSGHIVIDSGTEIGADVVMANIAALGFAINDVRFLLSSHEHFDHVGGLAKLQEASGATVITSDAAAPVLATGEIAANDPQAGMHEPFRGMTVHATIMDGETVISSDMVVRAIATPGHSPGALSWAWQECTYRCENIVFADSLSPISRDDYKFSDHPEYVAEYRAGLERLGREYCQILLTPHPSHSRMLKRMKAGKLTQNAPGDKPCASYAAGKSQDLNERLAKEASSE